MILVTGGTGFVGTYLLYELLKENSSIKSTYRKEKNKELTEEFFKLKDLNHPKLFNKIIWVKMDLTEMSSLDELYSGINIIYHCAAFVSLAKRHKNLLMETNVEGTSNIINYAIKHKIKKILFISSIASIGAKDYDCIINEEHSWNHKIKHTDYALSKYKSELEVWRGGQEGIPSVIVNPGFIIGSHFWNRSSSSIFKRIYNGLKFYPTGKISLVSVEDVVIASIKLMNSKIQNERFILVSENMNYKEFLDLISKNLGKSLTKYPLKKPLLYIIYFFDIILSFLRIKKRFMSKALISTFNNNQEFNGNKIKKFISFKYEKIDEKVKEICKDFIDKLV
tara:strand:- start:114 stop:1124 length:1011 start_codon:yes stop_codon:yes gene_type:complete